MIAWASSYAMLAAIRTTARVKRQLFSVPPFATCK